VLTLSGNLLAEGFLFVRRLREIDGNWYDLATERGEGEAITKYVETALRDLLLA